MDLYQLLSLAITQGISEFLPISSSGHLNLLQHFLGLTPSLSFDIFLNTATLFSVLFFFKGQVKYFFSNLKYILVGSMPVALIGIFLKDSVESIFANINLLPLFFLITGALLLSTRYLKRRDKPLNYKTAIIIGLFQSLAILPAISRSGSTIFAGLLLGLSPVSAFNFSFALFIPASIGALLLDFHNTTSSNFFTPDYLFSFVVTFLVGLTSLYYLKKILSNNKIWYFSFYVFFLSILLFFLGFRV